MLDAGDLMGIPPKETQDQNDFLFQVTSGFGYDAIGLGETDLYYGLDYLRKSIAENQLPFTSANVRETSTGQLLLPEYLVVEKNGTRFGIVSVMSQIQTIGTMPNQSQEVEILDPLTVLRDVLPRMRKECDTVVLIAHMGDQTAKGFVKDLEGIDLCLIGHTTTNIQEKFLLDGTAFLEASYEGRYIGRADIMVDKSSGKVTDLSVTVTSLDAAIADDPDMVGQIEAFKTRQQEIKDAKRSVYPRNLGSQEENFLGERVCKRCHQDVWDTYESTSHRKAFSTITTSGQNQEPECIVCHTTGYQYQNGYSEESPKNQMANVQCEACHGYGSTHARDGKWLDQARSSCVTCHDKANSPDFDYAVYWEKIKH